VSNLYDNFMSLVGRKLATVRYNADGELAIFKYSKRVFFDNLWGEDPLLNEARGIVIRVSDGAIVSYPFTKVYNYGERGAGEDLTDDDEVVVAHKVNGFMATVSAYDRKLLITTSGSFASPFVDMATEVLAAHPQLATIPPGMTFVFEIIHKDDPHVVVEREGAYLIGARHNTFNSILQPEHYLDELAACYGLRRVQHWISTVARVREAIETEKGVEGYMLRRLGNQETICKWKTKHYLRLKFLSRATFFLKEDFDRTKLYQSVEEEFYPLIDFVFDTYGVAAFKELSPEARVAILRDRL
jgi:ATP-dependent RNA circularization protein (DNA/RNA ligase family)